MVLVLVETTGESHASSTEAHYQDMVWAYLLNNSKHFGSPSCATRFRYLQNNLENDSLFVRTVIKGWWVQMGCWSCLHCMLGADLVHAPADYFSN